MQAGSYHNLIVDVREAQPSFMCELLLQMPTRVSMSEEADIQWGTIMNCNKAKTFYSSFISEGVVYELFDNVEVYSGDANDHSDPYIGKIVGLWEEKESGMRKVMIRWFFKLKDLDREMEGDPRELYLAFGKGKGVKNENDLEVICGKCKVLCTSKDARNRQPSAKDLKNADFFFSKIYNVDLQHLSPVQRIVDKLGCEAVYNKPEWVTEISKNKEQAVEQLNSMQDRKKDSTLKQEGQCMGGSPSDLKDRQSDFDAIIDKQQKACQGTDLKRQQTSTMNDISQSKKLKTSATTSPSTKVTANTMNDVSLSKKLKTSATTSSSTKVTANRVQNSENVPSLGEVVASKMPTLVATANRIQKSQNVSSLGEPVASKISNFGDYVGSSSKVEQNEHKKTDLPACAPPQTNLKSSVLERSLSYGKTSLSETPKVDDALGQQSVANTESSKQLDEKERADHNVLKDACIDAQKVKEGMIEGQTNSLTRVKSASGLLEQEAEKNPHEKREINSSAINLRDKGEAEADHKVGVSVERKGHQAKGDSSSLSEPAESVVKEARSDVTKKPILNTGQGSEKKLSTTEPVRVVENRKFFKVLPWEENLQQGILYERVLLLQNLDPYLTSADVRDMLKNILQGVSDARLIPQETACPYGQALVIFDSRLLAESALQEMERKCLVVANNRRPIIAIKFKETTNLSRFPGHLALEKLKLSRNLTADEYKKAVSTSHCSQPNTIEYEMAMEWRRLQEIIQTCRAELFERQRKEMEQIRKGGSSEGR